ncbi:uncharacterized protein LOC118438348 isoform X2 [Folsomia candida]|uniref:uncharacterized protein LOC118438348 isoform X2 n=1 Tax=Folsomia candida TaxID=158441 RepID=UPI00160526E6|nr:uncharacterized protein LOC118438348 isoform X2 [Folsomia candida]
MDEVWHLHKEMISVIRQINEIVKKVTDSMGGGEDGTSDRGHPSSVQMASIVDVSSSLEHFKKLKVHQVGDDGLNSEKNVASSGDISASSLNTEKHEVQTGNTEPVRQSRRLRSENKTPQRFSHDVYQQRPKSAKRPQTKSPPLGCLTNKKFKIVGQIKKPPRPCTRCNEMFRSQAFLQRHIRSNICEIRKKYRKNTYKPKNQDSTGFTITAKDFPHKCPNSFCQQSFMQEEHLAEHYVQCEKRVCLICYESVARVEFEGHVASCKKSAK